MKLNREELAWAAGFFDGEGTFHCGKDGQLQTMIAQNEPEVLFRFRDAVGVGNLTDGHTMPNGNEQFLYRTSSYEKTQYVICVLWNFLSGPKKAQAASSLRKAIKFQSEIKRRRKLNQAHGTINRYNYYGCRCDLCCSAQHYEYLRKKSLDNR